MEEQTNDFYSRLMKEKPLDQLLAEAEKSRDVDNLLKRVKIEKPTKVFDDIIKFYEFSWSDFKGVRKPFFLRWREDSINYINYSELLEAGTNARVRITENLLEVIGRALDRQVAVKGVRKNDLGQTLAFDSIPFKNAPQTIPKEQDFYKAIKDYSVNLVPKIPVQFDLIGTNSLEKIGKIEYILPHKKVYYVGFREICYRFTCGGVKLDILGSAIFNESQFKKLQTNLKRIKRLCNREI